MGVEGPSEPHRLKAECVAHGDGRATVAFAVDGNEVARTTDPDGPSGFSAIALHMRAEASDMEVLFDNVSVRRGETR